MKMVFRSIGMIVLLVSPSFSALLINDLEVVSPTGSHEYSEPVLFKSGSNYTITSRLIETSMGVLLVREHTRGGFAQMSHPPSSPGTRRVVFNFSSGSVREENMSNKIVILE